MSEYEAEVPANIANLSTSSSDASTSLLMSLPRELRDSIWTLVLGTRTVHVRCESFERLIPDNEVLSDPRDGTYDEYEEVFTDTLSFDKCFELVDEYRAYELAQQTNPNDPFGLRPICGACGRRPGSEAQFTHCRYCRRHGRYCENLWCARHGKSCARQHEIEEIRIDSFSLFRVSRQTRRETKAIQYAITTFSFQQADTLKTFIQGLSPLQRQSVKSIHLDIIKVTVPEAWATGVDNFSAAAATLTGLQTLHVSIRQRCLGVFNLQTDGDKRSRAVPDYSDYTKMLQQGSMSWWKNDLIHFRHPSLRNVTVIVESDDEVPIYTSQWDFHDQERQLQQYGHWTMAMKAEFAALLRAKLLAPSESY